MPDSSTNARTRDLPDAAPIELAAIRAVVDGARRSGRTALLETEGYAILRAAGLGVPDHIVVRDASEAARCDLDALAGDRVVVKVLSAGIAHKTEVGGVAVVPSTRDAVAEAVGRMADLLGVAGAGATGAGVDWPGQAAGVDPAVRADIGHDPAIAGYLVASFVEHPSALGGELLVSLRWTADFGAIVTVGIGGTEAEAIARHLQPDARVSIVAAAPARESVADALAGSLAVELATGSLRGRPPLLPIGVLADVVARLLALGEACCPADLAEIEVNPFAVTAHGLVALDVLARVGSGMGGSGAGGSGGGAAAPGAEAPGAEVPGPGVPVDAPAFDPARLARIGRLLEPRTVAVIGVSSRMNPGRIILRNLLRDGFDPARIVVVKPGSDAIDGVRCVPDLASLPGPVDLLVVAVSAADAPGVVAETLESDLAGGLIVIPGGLGEKEGSDVLVDRMREALDAARSRGDAPVVNGGNCLGIRSRAGGYDTMFIPTAKLPGPAGPPSGLALVSQSGGFAVARLSRLAALEPRYVVTVGNQVDLTVADYLAWFATDPSVRVVGAYVEGFGPGDGTRFLRAARALVASGRSVILYRAGRTAAGAAASASHTASIAGDAAVARALARQAGVVVADSLAEFDDLVVTFTRLVDRPPAGPRLAAVTNAGFECVAVADELGPLRLAPYVGATGRTIAEMLARERIDGVVDVHDPLDLTPMVGEAAYDEVVRAVLADDGVDMALVGVVPLAPPLTTLAPGPGHDEDAEAAGAIGPVLVRLFAETTKPWAVVVDSGPLFDPLRAILEAGGVPTFGTADAAVRALGRWWEARRSG